MSQQRFTDIERMAIWEAWGRKCAYTDEPVDFDSMFIDHIIPEFLLDEPDNLKKLLTELSLPEDFDITSYKNLCPCKRSPNLKKGAKILPGTIIFKLDIAASYADKIEERVAKLSRKHSVSQARGRLRIDLKKESLSVTDAVKESLSYADRLEEEGHEIDRKQLRSLLDEYSGKYASTFIDATVLEQNSGDTPLDKRIDSIREMVMNKSQTAMKLLNELWDELTDDTDPRIKFRVLANIGTALVHSGLQKEGAEKYLEAYNKVPSYEKAAAYNVLGLTLLGRADEAIDFGNEALKRIVDQGLSSSMYAASKYSTAGADPTNLIPPAHLDLAGVVINKIDYLRALNKEEWRNEALNAAIKFPNDKDIVRFAADARLEEIFGSGMDRTYIVSASDQTLIEQVIQGLSNAWQDELAKEVVSDTSCAMNLCSAYRSLRNYPAAIEVGKQALAVESDSQTIKGTLLRLGIESEDKQLVEQLTQNVQMNVEIMISLSAYYTNTAQWGKIISLDAHRTLLTEQHDLQVFSALLILAKTKLRIELDPINAISKFVEEFPKSAAGMIILSPLASEYGDENTANSLFQGAIDRSASLSTPEKYMLARLAFHKSDFESVKILLNWVPLDNDSDALHLLCSAYVNLRPSIHTTDVARKLYEVFDGHAYYNRVAGSLFYNAGLLNEAESALKKSLLTEPTIGQAHIALINTYLRRGDEKKATDHVLSIDTSSLVGSPYQKMGIAQLMAKYGRAEEAARFAYQVATVSQNDPKALQLYAGMFLTNQDARLIPERELVENDTWIEYEENGRNKHMVVEHEDSHFADSFPPAHAFAKAFLGKKIGDQVEWEVKPSTVRKIKIINVKHKYLAFLHEMMSSFNTKFPDETGFYQLEIQGDNLEPIFEEVRKASARQQSLVDMYVNGPLPLAMVQQFSGKSVKEVANQIIASGHEIHTCAGNARERVQAIESAINAFDMGLVFDTYTACRVVDLGLMPKLKEIYGRLIVSRATMDELLAWKESHADKNNAFMTIDYQDGQFVRTEYTKEQVESYIIGIENMINVIKVNCEIVAPAIPDVISDNHKQLLEVLDETILHPTIIASQENVLLVSEDIKFREISEQALSQRGVWLQPILIGLMSETKISLDEYIGYLRGLAEFRHGFLTVNASILLSSTSYDPSLQTFDLLARLIGGENADYKTHIEVILSCVSSVAYTKLDETNKKRVMGTMIERGMVIAFRLGRVREIVSLIRNACPYAYRPYFEAWLKGHFFT